MFLSNYIYHGPPKPTFLEGFYGDLTWFLGGQILYGSLCFMVLGAHGIPETNSSSLKMDGWNTIVSLSNGLFSGATVS